MNKALQMKKSPLWYFWSSAIAFHELFLLCVIGLKLLWKVNKKSACTFNNLINNKLDHYWFFTTAISSTLGNFSVISAKSITCLKCMNREPEEFVQSNLKKDWLLYRCKPQILHKESNFKGPHILQIDTSVSIFLRFINGKSVIPKKGFVSYLNNWMKGSIQRALYNIITCHSKNNTDVISMAWMQWFNSTDSPKIAIKLRNNTKIFLS